MFTNRRTNRCKVVWFDRTGACLLYKRLHHARFRLPAAGDAPGVRIDGAAYRGARLYRSAVADPAVETTVTVARLAAEVAGASGMLVRMLVGSFQHTRRPIRTAGYRTR